jgi:hypothetical protein
MALGLFLEIVFVEFLPSKVGLAEPPVGVLLPFTLTVFSLVGLLILPPPLLDDW